MADSSTLVRNDGHRMKGAARPVTALRAVRPDIDAPVGRTAAWVRNALNAGLLALPLPGSGFTRERYLALADFGSVDLDLARLAEGHADAVAILAELDQPPAGEGLWGVWAANPPGAVLTATSRKGEWQLTGTKPWCSGAGCCDYALVSADTVDGHRLFAVDLREANVTPIGGTWPGPAMAGSDTRSVRFESVAARAIGDPEGYLERPGFWHGAAGVAAVWWGGARGVARALQAADRRRPLRPHALAHAGAVDAALAGAESVILRAAQLFDADPGDELEMAAITAGRTRAVVEAAASDVTDRVGRALGAAPLALDREHARLVADLTLYLRQSHAEADLETLGRSSLDAGGAPWAEPGPQR